MERMVLSNPQKLIYEEEKAVGGSVANISGGVLFDGVGHRDKIKAAVVKICEANPILSTRIDDRGEAPTQYISEELPQVSILSFKDKEAFESFAQSQAETPIGITGALCEFYGILLPGQYGLFVRMHHIICDAWTLSLICKQFATLYADENANISAYPYADYIESEQKYRESSRFERDKLYWSEKLSKCDDITFLSDKQAGASAAARFSITLSTEKTKAIQKYCKNNKTSLFVFFTTALGCYMNRVRDNVQDFYVGTAVLNRGTMAEKNTMGMFINTIPLLLHIDENKTFAETLVLVQRECMESFRHQKFNYSDILSLYREQARSSGKLYDVIISYQNATADAPGGHTKWYFNGEQTESLQIHIDDRDGDGTLTINYDYLTEAFTAQDIQKLHEHLFNLLLDEVEESGISEADFSIHELPEDKPWEKDGIDIHIGKPIANTQIYIVDKYLNPVPIGVPGELCIAGDGVGAGYLNRPELTAEKFIDNPFGEGKLYKTGDIAKWRYDGNIDFIGRNDFQVKIRGLRIELGEIESAMSAFDGIRQAVVVAGKDESGHQYLAGYYTAEKQIDEKALRKAIGAKLPKYMVPHYFVALDEIPMTTSGKVNRKALPKPDFSTLITEDYVAPATETEKQLCGIFGEILHLEKVGVTDDFFDLGGDSLLSITLITKLEQAFDKHITTKDLMEHPTVADLIMLLGEIQGTSEKIEIVTPEVYPITPQQMGVYTSWAANPQSMTYNMPTRVAFPEDVDIERVKSAFMRIFENHRSLHTRFVSTESGVCGVYDPDCKLTFEADVPETEFVRPFDLTQAPLLRICFNGRTMLIDMHHIISDGTTIHNLLEELTAIYENTPAPIHEATYGDYALHIDHKIKENAYEKAFDFYRSMLAFDFEPMELPGSRHTEGETAGRTQLSLSKELFDKCRAYAKKNGITDTALFMSVYGLLLTRYCAADHVLTSVTLTNREYAQCRNTSGMFVNTVPVMFEIDETKTFESLAGTVNSLLLDIYQYQEVPFITIAEALKIEDKKAMNTSFVYQAQGEITFKFGGKELTPESLPTDTVKFDLTTELIPGSNGAELRMEYNADKLEDRMIRRMAESFIRLLEQIVN